VFFEKELFKSFRRKEEFLFFEKEKTKQKKDGNPNVRNGYILKFEKHKVL